ncbi:D-arabinono-1,4-lactone oxidase [Kitasatospora sp. NBC_01539]|uniref:D-arabinono-1,4-lactone oxidase n=1 Tax=Kitasatospora sp. NBC_01539 TaxID=2903577 RepID=UPI0038601B7C
MTRTDAPTNWARNTVFRARRVHRPASLDELRQIVAASDRVRALGTGHSFNRVADTTGDLVRLDALPGEVTVDPGRRHAVVAAGLRHAEVATRLHAQGLALANLASLPHISVAGACATGTHGSGRALQGLAGSVAALDLLTPDGGTVRLTRDDPAGRFDGAVVALGALGIATAVTLDVEPAFEIAQWLQTGVPLDAIAADTAAVFGSAYSVSAFTDWRSGTATVWQKRRTDREGGGDRPALLAAGAEHADRPLHPIPGMPPTYCTEQLGRPGPWHERLPHFRPEFTPSSGDELQSELLLPFEAAAEAVAAVRGLGERMAGALQISEIRTVAADDLWLSPAYGRDSIALHFTWTSDVRAVLPLIAAVEERLLPLGARPHWGKLTCADPADLAARYPRAADFAALAAELDPKGVFRNDLTEALFPSAA